MNILFFFQIYCKILTHGIRTAPPPLASVLLGVVRHEGLRTLYTGLSAALLRQATYTTTRLGIYTSLLERFSSPDGRPPSVMTTLAIAMTAGGTGAFVGTPAEVALIRMTSDWSLPAEHRRNYSGVFNALARIYREEGVAKLWIGANPTIARAMVSNAVQLTSYSQTKAGLVDSGLVKEGTLCQFMAAMFSGLLTTIASLPLDIIKTRLQGMKCIQACEYRGDMVDVVRKIVRHEGFFALWKGFTPFYFRVGPHTVLSLMFLEQLHKAYKQHVLGNQHK